MNFYKKTIFIFIIIIFTFAVLIKLVEPVIEKQVSNIFADKKLSKKLSRELISSTKDFTPEKREFYKDVIKKLYIKWIPLIEEAKSEAEKDINK
jgi:hypothetical protein|tara:strand:- start:284 stop:565 length:282 start_codon:yes stop_codon:yes gene_type:complete